MEKMIQAVYLPVGTLDARMIEHEGKTYVACLIPRAGIDYVEVHMATPAYHGEPFRGSEKWWKPAFRIGGRWGGLDAAQAEIEEYVAARKERARAAKYFR